MRKKIWGLERAGFAGLDSEIIFNCLAVTRAQVIIKGYVITNIYINVALDGLTKEKKMSLISLS